MDAEGPVRWAVILRRVGRPGHEYEMGETYPDEKFGQLAGQVAQAMEKPITFGGKAALAGAVNLRHSAP